MNTLEEMAQRVGRSCGSCTACCKLFAIDELQKPANVWCQHCPTGKGGCRIYETRPDICRAFYCLWRTDPALSEEWKPSKSRIVAWRNWPSMDTMFTVDPAVSTRWREKPYYNTIKAVASHGLNSKLHHRTYATDGAGMYLILPRQEIEVAGRIHVIRYGGTPENWTVEMFESPEQAKAALRMRPLKSADFAPMLTMPGAKAYLESVQ